MILVWTMEHRLVKKLDETVNDMSLQIAEEEAHKLKKAVSVAAKSNYSGGG